MSCAVARPAHADCHHAPHGAQGSPSEQHRVLTQIADLSARLIVMSERAGSFLRDVYDVPEAKIDLIAHGIPDMPFVDPNFYKDQFGVEGKFVALTFGLLSPNKGIEQMLRRCRRSSKSFPTSSTSSWGNPPELAP